MYVITYIEKTVREDNYDQGCKTDSRCVMAERCSITGDTLAKCLASLRNAYALDSKDTSYLSLNHANHGTVQGFSFSRNETDDSSSPTDSEIEEWKQGKRSMWLADYYCAIELRTSTPVPIGEFNLDGVIVE